MVDEEPILNFSLINFPSDRLTLKEMRKSFRTFGLKKADPDSNEPELGSFQLLVWYEESVAEKAFMRALGTLPELTSSEDSKSREQDLKTLAYYYENCGLHFGAHQVDLFVRQIESGAQAQANAHRTKTR